MIQSPSSNETFRNECGEIKEKHDLFVVSTFVRIAIAAMAVFAIVATQSYIPLAIAAVCSLPATSIAAGCMAHYYGLTTLISLAAAPALSTFALSFLLLTAGWYALNHYVDIKRVGLLETLFLTERPSLDYEPI